jgi:hypothetical protein
LDRSTLRRLEDKTDIHFSTKWRQAQKYADHVPHPLERLKENLTSTSKILLLDGKYVNIRGSSVCIHIAYDSKLGVIDFWIDDSENKRCWI